MGPAPWGPRRGSNMLGANELPLRQGFAVGKTLVRRKRRPIFAGGDVLPRKAEPRSQSDLFLELCRTHGTGMGQPPHGASSMGAPKGIKHARGK